MPTRKRPPTGQPTSKAKPTKTTKIKTTSGSSPSSAHFAEGAFATARKPITRFGAPLAAYDSGALVNLRLAATGNAQVFVFLHQDAKASKALVTRELGKHFSAEKESQVASLAMASGGRKRPPAFLYFQRLGVVLGTVDSAGFKSLRQRAGSGSDLVAAVHAAPVLGLIRPVRVAAAVPPAPQQMTWGLQALEVDQLWAQGITGKGVLVAHLDTGVDGTHPALQGAIGEFVQFDDLGKIVSPSPAAFDSAEHGTHTAATIAARPVNEGRVGVAPDALLASAMVIEGGNLQARVLGGLDWALQQRAKVLSMSLGFRGWVPSFIPLIQVLRQNDCLPVIAVGNEGPGTSRSPGNYVESLSVGACDENINVADFSSSQSFQRNDNPLVPDLIAPGVNVISAKPGGGFQSMDGTSMATPHVAGLAALLRGAKPEASVDQIEAAIFGSCAPVPSGASGRTERGLPNGPRALSLL
jgi:subtilisin